MLITRRTGTRCSFLRHLTCAFSLSKVVESYALYRAKTKQALPTPQNPHFRPGTFVASKVSLHRAGLIRYTACWICAANIKQPAAPIGWKGACDADHKDEARRVQPVSGKDWLGQIGLRD